MQSSFHEPHLTGKKGEEIASNYLKECQYEIVATNYRCRFGEIDIIARKNHQLHFIEVKTRKSTSFGHPVESYTYRKQTKIIKTAWTYLSENFVNNSKKPIFQFDLIALILDSNNRIKELKYYEHAIHQS